MENLINDYINMIKLVGISITIILFLAIFLSIIIIRKKKQRLNCRTCNRVIDKDSIYCKWCGTKV